MTIVEIIKQNEWIVFLGLILVYMYYNKQDIPENVSNSTSSNVEINDAMPEELFSWHMKYLYLSNGKQIPAPHVAYYTVLLGLGEFLPINLKKIQKAYFKRFEEVAEQRKHRGVLLDVAELKAAKDFLTDRYNYTAYLN